MTNHVIKGAEIDISKEVIYVNNLASRLITDDDFDFAMKNRSPVTVWMDKRLLGFGDNIEKYDAFEVIIDGEHYVRSVCDFRLT